MNAARLTPSMRLVHLQSVLHWLFPMRHSREYGAAVRQAIATTVQAGKAARSELRNAV